MTESGKTTLAKSLARHYKSAGYGVLVLDPLRDPEWQCDYITDNPDEFLKVFWRSRRCMVFMDEGGESVGRYNVAMQKTATRGRHWGHSCHYIAQRAMQMAPLVRDQCSHLFLFCSSARDGALLADEFNAPILEEATNLKQGEYFHAVKFGAIQRHNMKGNAHDPGTSRRRTGDTGTRPAVAGEATREAVGEGSRVGTDATESPGGPGPGHDGEA